MGKQKENNSIKAVPMMLVFAISAFTGLLSETGLNMAYTNIMEDFEITAVTAQWLTTGFLLVMGVLVPVSAYLIQRFTARQLFTSALLFIIAGTFTAAISSNFETLLAARVIQASGLAVLIPLMFNMVLVVFPISRRGLAMGAVSLIMLCGPALGPTFAGMVIEKLEWHWIFWFTLPLFICSLIIGQFLVMNVTEPSKPKLDILSAVMSTIGFGGIVLGFSAAGEGGGEFISAEVMFPILIGILFLILFSFRQFNLEKPFVDLRVFKYPMFTIGVLLVFIGHMTVLSAAILFPMYLKVGLGLSALAAGLIMLPGEAMNGVMSLVNGRIMDHYGPKWLVRIGAIMLACAIFLFTKVMADTSIVLIIFMHIGILVGVSMFSTPSSTNGLNQLPRHMYPDGTAAMNTLMQIAGAIGTAISVTLMSKGQEAYAQEAGASFALSQSMVAGVRFAFLFLLIAAVIALISGVFVKRVEV